MGAEASVTISGWRADSECAEAVKAKHNELYLRESPPTEGVICEVSRHGRRYVVRDRGLFLLTGRALCAALTRPDQPTPNGDTNAPRSRSPRR